MVNGKDVDALFVREISTTGNGHDMSKSYTKIHSYNLVHENVKIVAIFVSKYNAYSVASFLTLDEDSATTNELEYFPLWQGKGYYANIVVSGIFNDKTFWGRLFSP
eukprot:CAMPEP_0171308012 /NCGR_PEP_ID=MMETSP0816-20121228/18107_1 /TAXON_ID=420281 /ORGANISM="Proboscia inermis, Strain CCAP1064/1" /LENGTH=105 /DNA_ID=CAMNT_0011790609 /DNA_START=184 /DNA_END=501 /DNA_ORIENTATION=-